MLRVKGLGQPHYQHLLGFSHTPVLLLHVYHGAILTVVGLLKRHIISRIIAFTALEAKFSDGEGCNVQGGVDALTARTAILLNGVPTLRHQGLALYMPAFCCLPLFSSMA